MGATPVEGDITDAGSVEAALSRSMPDAVYHCAARVWDDDERKLFRDNAEGTLTLVCHIEAEYDLHVLREFFQAARRGESGVQAE